MASGGSGDAFALGLLVSALLLCASGGRAQSPDSLAPTAGGGSAALPPPSRTSGSRELGLREALSLAARQSSVVQRAHSEVRAAGGRATQSRSALLPQITGVAGYARVHGSGAIRPTELNESDASAGFNATYNRFNFGVAASQTLWDYGAIERLRAAGLMVEAASATERAEKVQLELDVRQAFFAARAQRALIAVQQETLDNQEISQREIATFVRIGTRPQIDLLQAETDLANAQVAFLTAQNRYRVAKASLRQVIAWRQADAFEVGDDEMPALPEESRALALLVAQAFDNRPELRALLRQRASALATARAARAGYLPTLAAEGGLAKTGIRLDDLNSSWDVGVTLTWQLFQGGLTAGELEEAEALADIQTSELETTRLQVQFEVEQATAVIEDNNAALSAANDALRLARAQLEQAQGRYKQGVSNIVELRDAQLAVTSASAQLVQAQLNASTSRAQLLAALGQES